MIAMFQETNAQFQTGDVFVSVANGSVQWRQPNGTLVQTLNTGQGGFTTGMAFDSAFSLYVTCFSASRVFRFDNNGNPIGLFGSGNATPESIVFDGASNCYVGNLGNGIRKYDALGNFIATVGPNTDFFDLSADQCTVLNDHEGQVINRHDVCTNTPLSDFATGLGGSAFALRIRTNGDVMLANGVNILRLNSAGVVQQTYDIAGQNAWFALNLDPDGTSFWSADFSTADVFRMDIATGNVISTFNTGTGGNTVFGLAVAGEITVATQLFISVAPKFSTNPINTQHCITATIVDQNAVPQANQNVTFQVRGVNGIVNGNGNTNGSGQVQFCYVGTNIGQDTIFATISATGKMDTAYKTWDDPAPVELSSFTSVVDRKDVKLSWTTSEEVNNSGFDIERSVVNGEWSKISFVQGNGTTTNQASYTYTDKNLSSGKYNYRLKQIDFNGNFEYFNLSNEVVVGVPTRFTLSQNYPNPFNPSTKINFELPTDGNVNLYVYDNSGKLMATIAEGFKSAGYYNVDFNAANLASGIYFYKLEYNTNGQNFDKVMKMTVVK